ncbi:hypothetical protein ColTof4_01212 [Colletotrichum tofieldiae]|nr:hypothetical protein ColTof4_01212 [Colletotrichum tofieldiae]
MIQRAIADLEARLQSLDDVLAAATHASSDFGDRIKRVQTQSSLEPDSSSPVDADPSSVRVTNESMKACTQHLAQTVARLEENLRKSMDRLVFKAAAGMSFELDARELSRLQEALFSACQCLDIFRSVANQVMKNVSIITNEVTGENNIQFLVSTTGKTLRGKNTSFGSSTRQFAGHMSGESLEKLFRDATAILATSTTADNTVTKFDSRYGH